MSMQSSQWFDQEGNNAVPHELPTQGQLLVQCQQELQVMYRLQLLHLNALRVVSEALGHPYAGDASKSVLDLAALAAETIKRARSS